MQLETNSPQLEVLERVPSGSNLVYRCADTAGSHWVYKPVLGERPLTDFPEGTLACRELAAYLISRAIGWEVVPRTVAATGPGGIGMAQQWIATAPDPHGAPVQVHSPSDLPEGQVAVLRGHDHTGSEVVLSHSSAHTMRRIALFDQIINNADRKGSHLLADCDGRIWAIDHGLCFHTDPKLRTVVWGWAGHRLLPPDLADLRALTVVLHPGGGLAEQLKALLSEPEIDALRARISALIAAEYHPHPSVGYPLPWPLF